MKVKIGLYTYKVKFVKHPARSSSEKPVRKMDIDGLCDNPTQTIYVRNTLTEVAQKDTLIHELLHAIWYVSGYLMLDDLPEESAVRILSPWLTGMIIENPELMEFLQQ